MLTALRAHFPAPTGPVPLLSVRGTLGALRPPTPAELLFSAKAALAVALCLIIGFSQNLENPYWSAVTVYVLVGQSEAGAIRSKAMFRLVGTLLGGAGAIVLTALSGGHIGVLLCATLMAVLVSYYPKTLDRTPASYTWFVTPLTLAVVGIAQVTAPDTIFMVALTRMGEICLAILMVALVDSLILPRAATPAFLRTMAAWRGQARDAATAALSPGTDPQAWRKLTGLIGQLDALGVQLPYDIVPCPPSARHMRLIRLTIAHLIAHLASVARWSAAIHAEELPEVATLRDELRMWLLASPEPGDPALPAHAAQADALRARLAALENDLLTKSTLRHAAAAAHMADLARDWARLALMLHAIATGRGLPAALRDAARRARPARALDYLVGVLDIAPMALALAFCTALWYFTTWTASIAAMLFVFLTVGFIVGTPGASRSARGITVWIACTSLATLAYQFAILPRVTAFPVLLGVLMVALLPLGVLITMSPAGVLILANGFAFLGLQSAYAADFGTTLELLLGSLAGCIIAMAALYLCQFDRARFRARRLAAAQHRDLATIATGWRQADRDRLLSLGIDRVAQFGGLAAALPEGDPLKKEDLFACLPRAANLQRLRAQESALPPDVAAHVKALRSDPAQWTAACDAVLASPPGTPRREALIALTGLHLEAAS